MRCAARMCFGKRSSSSRPSARARSWYCPSKRCWPERMQALTQIIRWESLEPAQRCRVLARPAAMHAREVEEAVARIIERVRTEGDGALQELTRRFDHAEVP